MEIYYFEFLLFGKIRFNVAFNTIAIGGAGRALIDGRKGIVISTGVGAGKGDLVQLHRNNLYMSFTT
jgi:hypothetical protein